MTPRYLLRLDDASDHMDTARWKSLELMLDRYGIKPLVGIIPINRDDDLTSRYKKNDSFWNTVRRWEKKGWSFALHGCYHRYTSHQGGSNPIHDRSEFAGLPLIEQRALIKEGMRVLKEHGISVSAFFAPSHTFDEGTIEALRTESDIRIISDTIALDAYFENGFYFVPVQAGRVRDLPFRICTFCYHPNSMNAEDFQDLESFLIRKRNYFASFGELPMRNRKKGLLDKGISRLYFFRRKFL